VYGANGLGIDVRDSVGIVRIFGMDFQEEHSLASVGTSCAARQVKPREIRLPFDSDVNPL